MARILILEPAQDVRGLVAYVVRRLGHEPLFFASSRSESPPDVDALVLEPSWKCGLAVARTLRQRDKGLPLVCISVWPAEELGAEVAALAAHRYLLKPFSVAELKEALAILAEE
jgi:DNA-binding response OmpR family regulator